MSGPGLRVSAEVGAPPEATWGVLTDWDHQSSWALGTRARGRGPTGGHAVGEEILAWTGVGRFAILDSMVIEAWDPPHRCAVRKTGRVVRGRSVFSVEALPGQRSRVVYDAQVDLPLGSAGRLAWPVVRPVVAAGFRRSLRTLARQVEQGARG